MVKIHSNEWGDPMVLIMMPEGTKVVRRLPPDSVEASVGTTEELSVVAFMMYTCSN